MKFVIVPKLVVRELTSLRDDLDHILVTLWPSKVNDVDLTIIREEEMLLTQADVPD